MIQILQITVEESATIVEREVVRIVTVGTQGQQGTSGVSGYSGFSGANPGASGASGASGFSGFSGANPGASGFSGASGTSGFSGFSGFSGLSGFSGASGKSGNSGASGASGKSGASGTSGESGASGQSGFSGESGFSGTGASGASGASGAAGASGASGASGFSGESGFSGTSGFSGDNPGSSGASGTSGFSGASGVSGAGGGSSTQTYAILPQFTGTATSTTIGTTNLVRVFRILLPSSLTVNRLVFRNSTAVGGSLVSVGIYNEDGSSLLVDAGPQSGASVATLNVALGAPVVLTPGMYLLAWTGTNTTNTVSAIDFNSNALETVLNATTAQLATAANASVAGQLPATLGTLTATGSAIAVPYVKLQN